MWFLAFGGKRGGPDFGVSYFRLGMYLGCSWYHKECSQGSNLGLHVLDHGKAGFEESYLGVLIEAKPLTQPVSARP